MAEENAKSSGSGTGRITALLIVGFLAVSVLGAVLLYTPGRAHIATGIVWGLGIAYLGFLLFYFLIPRPGSNKAVIPFFRGYLPGAALRYIIMVGALCAVLFWIHVNIFGVLIGAFAGMMTSTFASVSTMKRQSTKSPEESKNGT